MKNMKDCVEDEFRRSIRYKKGIGVSAEDLAKVIGAMCSAEGIPANVTADTVKSGGIFGSVYPCVVIAHPAPPQSYFEHVVIFNGDALTFRYFGYSQAVYNKNKKELLQREGKLIQSALVKHDPMALDTEFRWHDDVNDVIEKIVSE